MVWSSLWKGCTVCCHSDIAVVFVINQQTAKNGLLSHLLRCQFFATAIFDFDLVARHVPGMENGVADALSCNRLDLFHADEQCVHLPDPTVSITPGGAQQGPSRVGDSPVDGLVQFYFDHALAPSTQRTYKSAQSRYYNFCSSHGIPPLPVIEIHFITTLAAQCVSHKSLKGYIAT